MIRRAASVGPLGGWVDDLADFVDAGGRKAAQLGVAVDHVFVLGQIDAEGTVAGDV